MKIAPTAGDVVYVSARVPRIVDLGPGVLADSAALPEPPAERLPADPWAAPAPAPGPAAVRPLPDTWDAVWASTLPSPYGAAASAPRRGR